MSRTAKQDAAINRLNRRYDRGEMPQKHLAASPEHAERLQSLMSDFTVAVRELEQVAIDFSAHDRQMGWEVYKLAEDVMRPVETHNESYISVADRVAGILDGSVQSD